MVADKDTMSMDHEHLKAKFTNELQALLDRWDAELQVEDGYEGGRIEATLNGHWNEDGQGLRPYVYINLGSCMFPMKK